MNKTALRHILASEGLLPQKKVASKALARMLTDFYKQFAREMNPILRENGEDPVDVRLYVRSDMQEIMGDVGELHWDLQPSEDGLSAYADCEIHADRPDFDMDISVSSEFDITLLGWEDEDAKEALRDKWEERWNDFMDKFMKSKDFEEAVIKRGLRIEGKPGPGDPLAEHIAHEVWSWRWDDGMDEDPANVKNMRFSTSYVRKTLTGGGDLVIKFEYVGEIIDENYRG